LKEYAVFLAEKVLRKARKSLNAKFAKPYLYRQSLSQLPLEFWSVFNFAAFARNYPQEDENSSFFGGFHVLSKQIRYSKNAKL